MTNQEPIKFYVYRNNHGTFNVQFEGLITITHLTEAELDRDVAEYRGIAQTKIQVFEPLRSVEPYLVDAESLAYKMDTLQRMKAKRQEKGI